MISLLECLGLATWTSEYHWPRCSTRNGRQGKNLKILCGWRRNVPNHVRSVRDIIGSCWGNSHLLELRRYGRRNYCSLRSGKTRYLYLQKHDVISHVQWCNLGWQTFFSRLTGASFVQRMLESDASRKSVRAKSFSWSSPLMYGYTSKSRFSI